MTGMIPVITTQLKLEDQTTPTGVEALVVMENDAIMEETTIQWISNTIFYISLFFVLFLISKIFFRMRNWKIDLNDELTNKDNVSFTLVTTGYFCGVLVIFVGVIQGDSIGFWQDALLVISYGIIGNVLLVISSLINERVIFPSKVKLYREVLIKENLATGVIEGANFLGSSLIVYGAITGKTVNLFPDLENVGLYMSGFISLIGFWLVGQVILTVFLKVYTRYSRYRIWEQLSEGNNAVGIVYASIIVAIGFLFGQSIKGDIVTWTATLENILYYLGLGLILLPFARIFMEKVILPKSNLRHEIVGQEMPNQGAAFLEAFAYIGSAVLISYCI